MNFIFNTVISKEKKKKNVKLSYILASLYLSMNDRSAKEHIKHMVSLEYLNVDFDDEEPIVYITTEGRKYADTLRARIAEHDRNVY